MPLGLGASLSKASIVTPGVVTDNLVMKHMYPVGAVQPLSDGAAYFDGSSDINISGVRTSLTTEHTMMAWIMRTDTGAGEIFSSTDGNYYRLFIYADGSNDWASWFAADSADIVTTDQIPQNTWTHLAVTFSKTGNAQKNYRDGIEITSGTMSNDPTVPSSNYEIGKDFAGYICNAGIWARALTQAEIKSVMWKQYADLTGDASSGDKKNLISWYSLDEETDTDGTSGTGGVKDHHGSNHGTLA